MWHDLWVQGELGDLRTWLSSSSSWLTVPNQDLSQDRYDSSFSTTQSKHSSNKSSSAVYGCVLIVGGQSACLWEVHQLANWFAT